MDSFLTRRNVGIIAFMVAMFGGAFVTRAFAWLSAPKWARSLAGVGVAALLVATWWPSISYAATDVKRSVLSLKLPASSVGAATSGGCDVLTAEQVASVLFVAGFRGEDLVHLVAIGKRESGYRPSAHRSDQDKALVIGDRGLFQINYIHDPALKAAGIITTASDLFDPLVNARAARFLFERSGLFPWNMTAGGWQANGVPFHGTNVDSARAAVANAEVQGLLTGDLAEFQRQTAACSMEVK